MKTLIWITVALIILAGAWWYFGMSVATAPIPTPTTDTVSPNPATTTDNATTTGTTTDTGASAAPMSVTVVYGSQGFTPATVTIAKGGSVKWVNESGSSMWVATDEHPSHIVYAGTTRQQHCPDASGEAFDQCAPGNDYSFTFSKTGLWQYHDHMNAARGGTVVVQ